MTEMTDHFHFVHESACVLHDVPERPDLDLAVGAHRRHQAPPLAHVHRTHAAPHVVELSVGLFAAEDVQS